MFKFLQFCCCCCFGFFLCFIFFDYLEKTKRSFVHLSSLLWKLHLSLTEFFRDLVGGKIPLDSGGLWFPPFCSEVVCQPCLWSISDRTLPVSDRHGHGWCLGVNQQTAVLPVDLVFVCLYSRKCFLSHQFLWLKAFSYLYPGVPLEDHIASLGLNRAMWATCIIKWWSLSHLILGEALFQFPSTMGVGLGDFPIFLCILSIIGDS